MSIAAFNGAIREEDAGNEAVIQTVCVSRLHRVFIGFMGFVVWVISGMERLHVLKEREDTLDFVSPTQFAARFWHKIHMAMHGGRRLSQHKNQGLRYHHNIIFRGWNRRYYYFYIIIRQTGHASLS